MSTQSTFEHVSLQAPHPSLLHFLLTRHRAPKSNFRRYLLQRGERQEAGLSLWFTSYNTFTPSFTAIECDSVFSTTAGTKTCMSGAFGTVQPCMVDYGRQHYTTDAVQFRLTSLHCNSRLYSRVRHACMQLACDSFCI